MSINTQILFCCLRSYSLTSFCPSIFFTVSLGMGSGISLHLNAPMIPQTQVGSPSLCSQHYLLSFNTLYCNCLCCQKMELLLRVSTVFYPFPYYWSLAHSRSLMDTNIGQSHFFFFVRDASFLTWTISMFTSHFPLE